jgi:glycolate oxidase FAD binding subunit
VVAGLWDGEMTVDSRSLKADLASVCPTWRELDPVSDSELTVDGLLPGLWCEPGSPEEVGEVLRLADRAGAAVIPLGGGTRRHLGRAPRAADLLLSMRGLTQIVEYEAADLTVTLQAGMRLGELQHVLAGQQQQLALDPPGAARATIGGVVASNASGPSRLQYGSARDLVIGTRVANPGGVLTKAGGRVVKNVAGYDLNKLYTGSLGTLGILVELSFKLHPVPRSRGTVLATFADVEQAAAVVSRIMRSPLGPTALEILDARAAVAIGASMSVPAQGCLLAVLVGGFDNAVARIVRDIADFSREQDCVEVQTLDAEKALWDAIRELADASRADRPVLKLAVPPARSAAAFTSLRAILGSRELPAELIAHAGTGLVYARLEAQVWEEAELARLASAAEEAREFAARTEGSLVLESCPAALKQRLDVWGEIGPALQLMRALKQQLDPRGTLNPGRFVGGI